MHPYSPDDTASIGRRDWHAVAGAFACVLLFTLPFAHSVAVRNLALVGAWLALIAAWRTLAVPRIPLLWLFGAYAGLGSLSLLWAVDPAYSAGELKTEVLYPFLTFVLFFAAADRKWIERFRRTLMAATMLAVVSAAYFLAVSQGGRTDGFFNGPGMYSTFLVGVYPLTLVWALAGQAAPRERLFHMAALASILVGGMLTQNRMLWVVLALQTMLVLVLRTRKWPDARAGVRLLLVAVLVALTAAMALYALSGKRLLADLSAPADVAEKVVDDIRLRIWARAAVQIAEHPLAGAGFGRGALRQDLRDEFGHKLYWHSHNIVLNHGISMGVPGVALVLLLFGSVLAGFTRTWREAEDWLAPYALAGIAMTAGMFLKNMTDDLFVRQSALLFWALAGMTFGARARARDV